MKKIKMFFNGWMIFGLVLALVVFRGIGGARSTEESIDLASFYQIARHAQPTALTSMDYRQLRCVTTAIYYESAYEPELGKVAVARVIQNRVAAHTAPTACDVVFQKTQGVCQFSWACGSYHEISAKECPDCWRVATQVFAQNQYRAFLPHAMFFHATQIDPQWRGLDTTKTIGHHKFYNKFSQIAQTR